MIITALVVGAVAVIGGTVAVNEVKNKKYADGELTKTDENTLQQFDESAFSDEQKADFEESAEMSVSDYQKIIAQMQEEIKAKKSEFNASKKGRGLLGTIGDGFKSLFGGGSGKVKRGIESAEEKLNALIAKEQDVTLAEIQEVYKEVMGTDLDLAAVQATMSSTDGTYTVKTQNADGTVSEVTYSKEDIVAKIQENAKRLQEKFDKTKSDQGIISKGLGCVNNFLGIGTTGNEAQAQISAFIELAGSISASDDDATFAAKFKAITGNDLTEQAISQLMFDVDAYIEEYEKNSSVPLTDLEKEQIKDYYTMMGNNPANEAIMDYESTQESITEGFNMIVTTAVVIAAVAAAPFTGGASIALGAAVGAAVNVGLNATNGLTSADGYSLEECAMDAISGAANGALAGAGGAIAGKAASATGKLALTKVGGKVVAKVGEGAVKGAITGAIYGAGSSAANYTINTAVKNEIIEGEVVESMGEQCYDDDGNPCMRYPVVDRNGDFLYYEIHVYDQNGNFVEIKTSNDFSLGGLASSTASGAVTGAVAGGVAGKAGFQLGHSEGTTAQRLATGTKIGAMGGAAGGAANGVTSWAQSGFEGGLSGLTDSMVDGTLEGGVAGGAAGFAVSAGQIAGEKAAPKVLNHVEGKYEQAQARKLAADAKAPKVEGDPDGPDAPKTKAQQRADKRVAKYEKQYEVQSEKVKNYGYADEAKAAADKKAEFDDKLAKGEVDPVETRMDKIRSAGDDLASKAKARNDEMSKAIKEKGGKYIGKAKSAYESLKGTDGEKKPISERVKSAYESLKGADGEKKPIGERIKSAYKSLKSGGGEKKPILERIKDRYTSAKESSKATYETVKAEKGLVNKGKALFKIGKGSLTSRFSKFLSKFTNTDAAATSADPKSATAKSSSTTSTSSTSSSPKMSDSAARSLERISGYDKTLASKLEGASISDSALAKIEEILKVNSGKSISGITVNKMTGDVSFRVGSTHCDVSGNKVILDGFDTSYDAEMIRFFHDQKNI